MANDAVAQLRAAIDRSGLSASEYARTILTRDPRTVRRWLSGESPIPQAVCDYLDHYHEGPNVLATRQLRVD